jgi:protein-disulfide isomerase
MDSKKRQTRIEKRRQEQRKKQIRNLIIMGVGAIIVVGFLVIPGLLPAAEREHAMANGNAMGDPNAPVTIEIFSDFQCSHCYDFFTETEEQLIQDYIATGDVYYVYHAFGTVQGAQSGAAAEAAYCAGDQGKFWEYHDTLFNNYTRPNRYSAGSLMSYAEDLGLDMDTFSSCYNDHTYAGRVQQDLADASSYGVSGTPSFVINGQLAIPGNAPYEDFKSAISRALAEAGQ